MLLPGIIFHSGNSLSPAFTIKCFMNSSNPEQRIFTLRQANQMLPLVQSITSDIVELANEVHQTRQRLDYLSLYRISEPETDIYQSEVLAIEKGVAEKSTTIENFTDELTQLNLLTERVQLGYVHFPASRKSERVCLCWKSGDTEIKFWHGVSENCDQRRAIDLELIRQSADHALV